MTPAGARIMEVLLSRALDAGEVELRSAQLYQGGRPVMPRLDFVADQERATSTSAADIQGSAGGQHEEKGTAYPTFAPLPANRLIPDDKVTADRARRAQQQHPLAELLGQRREGAQRFRWPASFAPLPPPALTRKDR